MVQEKMMNNNVPQNLRLIYRDLCYL